MKKYAIVLAMCLSATAVQADCLVDTNSMAGVKLGQTLAQVKRTYPKVKISHESDAEGVEYTVFQLAPNVKIHAHFILAHINDGSSTVKEVHTIESLETFSPACHTATGVAPNMPLKQVAQKLGSLKKITLNEIEMREFAEFSRQPAWLTLRAEDGDYGKREIQAPMDTKKFLPNAKIISLIITQ